ncbi:MAG: hypothetical protein ACRDCW_12720 [Sarcina sp.]
MIDIRNNDILGPKTRMTFNLVKGAVLAIFVILDQVCFHLNGYLFLALLVGLFIVMELITKLIIKTFYW